MTRYFNTEGLCRPKEHYMVRLDDRMAQIKRKLVDRKKYFVINKGRQYGKTTTLRALADYLSEDYFVFSLDFQEMPDEKFESGETFSKAFACMLCDALEHQEGEGQQKLHGMLAEFIAQNREMGMDGLFAFISHMCRESSRPAVLIIDEVDSASNNQVFVKFLAQMRACYLKRDMNPTFHSVILAGLYDIKNLKLKIRPELEHQYNSPWNIAARFDVEMSFSAAQIAKMIGEYEEDYHTGMDIQGIAEEIYAYTSGYPVLVSTLCKYMDEDLPGGDGFDNLSDSWTKAGVAQAVKNLLDESTPLFESMVRQLDTYKELEALIEGILYQGRRIPFNRDEKAINIGVMFGFLKNRGGQVAVANRIFEMRLLNLFVTREAIRSEIYARGEGDRNQFVRDGRLDMDAVMQKFVEYFSDIWSKNDEAFVEKYGRKFFLLFLKPIINGTGNYYMEAETRDLRRTDVIVDYLGEQFIVELKIWHGSEYNERGENQLVDYLDYYHKDKGYMLSFNFNQKKEVGVKTITVGDKTVVEAVV
ncbi:MAG: ATP-binding protein [Lachnospiraceae bacterium]|nr:ATP-binding protein [Lachnospiraceae bacterium]